MLQRNIKNRLNHTLWYIQIQVPHNITNMYIAAHEDWLSGTCNLQYICDACSFLSLSFNHCKSIFRILWTKSSFKCCTVSISCYRGLLQTIKRKKQVLFFIHLRIIITKLSKLILIALKSRATITISMWNTDRRAGKRCENIYWELRCCTLRQINKRPGVYIYLWSDFTFSLLQDIKIEEMESIGIEIMLPKQIKKQTNNSE